MFPFPYYRNKDLLYRLVYHDIYWLYEHIKNSEIEEIIPIDVFNKLQFKVKFNDISIEFGYDTSYEWERMHHINGVSLMGDGTDDPLQDMLEKVLNEIYVINTYSLEKFDFENSLYKINYYGDPKKLSDEFLKLKYDLKDNHGYWELKKND